MDGKRTFNMVKLLFHFIKMMRYKNLFIIAFTMVAMRYFVIEPILIANNFSLQFPLFYFLLLVLATTSIAAAGNIINDYFDVRSDLINKPQRVVIGKHIDRKAAILWHLILSTLGVVLAFYVSYKINQTFFTVGFMLIVTLLWLYCTEYKKWLLLGNFIVALLTGLVPMVVLIYEIPSLNLAYWESLIRYQSSFRIVIIWVACFALFGFVTNFMREIIKDIEDLEGDNAYGCRTLPIVFGVTTAKVLVSVFNISLILAIMMIMFYYLGSLFSGMVNMVSIMYVILFIIFPLLIVQIALVYASQLKHYNFIHTMIKWVMFFGLFYTVVFRILMGMVI